MPWAFASTSAPLVENGLTSTMVEETAIAAMKPIGADAGSGLQERHRERDQRAEHRRRGGEGRDHGADEAQQQGGKQRRGEARDAVADESRSCPSCSSTAT